MVFPDLSAPEVKPQQTQNLIIPIAAVADRLLALVLDFLILSPVISLVVAGLIRQTKTYFLLNSSSPEGTVAALLVIIAVVFLATLLQSVFLYFWQATPGQFFLQMRVVSYPQGQERLSVNQCLIRSFLWCGGFLFLALPYLEVLSHPLRRAFNERASDTLVITLKQNFDEGPYPLESRFISSWLRMSFLFLLLFCVLGFFKVYHGLVSGVYREKENANPYVCKEMKDVDLTGASRLDAALALFLLNEISPGCLEKESEASLWGDPVNSQELAYLAKFFVTEGEMQKEYLGKICSEATSAVCLIGRYMNDDSQPHDLASVTSSLWTTRLLLSEEKFAAQDYVGSLKIIEELQKEPVLKIGLEKRYIRSIWALNESQKMIGGRTPASAKEAGDSWIDVFKEKYEVP